MLVGRGPFARTVTGSPALHADMLTARGSSEGVPLPGHVDRTQLHRTRARASHSYSDSRAYRPVDDNRADTRLGVGQLGAAVVWRPDNNE